MKKWGILITAFYVLLVAVVIAPLPLMLLGNENTWAKSYGMFREWWLTWVWVAILVGGQIVLLLVSVDTSWQRLKPRQHLLVSAGTSVILLGLLTFVAAWSLAAAAFGDGAITPFYPDEYGLFIMLGCWIVLWFLWGIVFFLYLKRRSLLVDRVVGWLLRGSVLELLIAVPCHVIVRRRDDCSAPVATGFGIATGLAIMLLAFGPSIWFLFKRRMGQYEK